MANINFYLKSTKKDKIGKVPVIAQIAVDYKKYRKQIGKVKPADWKKKPQRLKLTGIDDRSYREYLDFNTLLDEIEKKARKLFNTVLLEKRKPTESEIKNLFFNTSQIDDINSNSFFNVFEEFIKFNKADKAERTIKGYTTVKNYLKKFQTETDYLITWERLDSSFIDEFKRYTFQIKQKQNGYYAKIIAVLSTFLKWAKERNYYEGDFYEDLKAKEPDKEVIFLTLDELFTLYKYEFKSDRLNNVRDLYCFSCFTGLRYSDIETLRHEHINGQSLQKYQKKTNVFRKIPLNEYALEILSRHKKQEQPLPVISNQKINKYLKECCEKIASEQEENKGFNTSIILRKEIGKNIQEETIPKHKAITFHTARKTFITNSIMLGMSLEALKEMGGPKKERDIKKYVKITESYKKEMMDKAWGNLPGI